MSATIEVRQLSKHFRQHQAVDTISFTAARGRILGLLGPNGAGKSTLMKMLTGYLTPSQGQVWIGGHSMATSPQQAKKCLGYLHEHNPLYMDMYVREYLQWMGSMHGLPRRQYVTDAQEVMAQCGIAAVQHKKLRVLSKGYRQRVGLAQALIHDPAVLILDEPTTGLDPNQLHGVRKLIKEASRSKAVILSTHIMQEVETLCDDVLLMHQGKMIFHGTMAQLLQRNQTTLYVTFKEPIEADRLLTIPGVQHVQPYSAQQYVVSTTQHQDVRERLFRWAQAQGLTLLRLEPRKHTLDEIFWTLTEGTST